MVFPAGAFCRKVDTTGFPVLGPALHEPVDVLGVVRAVDTVEGVVAAVTGLDEVDNRLLDCVVS